jgi:hypothetical protein
MARVARLFYSHDDDHEGADRQTGSLAGLAVALLLVVMTLFVMRQLQTKAALEDCLFAGRRNCDAAIVATP